MQPLLHRVADADFPRLAPALLGRDSGDSGLWACVCVTKLGTRNAKENNHVSACLEPQTFNRSAGSQLMRNGWIFHHPLSLEKD